MMYVEEIDWTSYDNIQNKSFFVLTDYQFDIEIYGK